MENKFDDQMSNESDFEEKKFTNTKVQTESKETKNKSISVNEKGIDNSILGKHYVKIYDSISSYTLDYNNLANTILKIMEQVDKEKVSGPVKKDLTIKIMSRLIKDLDMSNEDRISMTDNCSKLFSNYIDVLVSVTKGQTTINKIVKPNRIFF